MSLQQITNYLQVTPLIGSAGMPTADQLTDVQAAGYELVIYLALVDSPGAIPDEAERVRALGMQFVHIPVVWEHPLQDDLDRFFEVMTANEDRKIFVHCVKNMRVSVFLCLYRTLVKNLPFEEAFEPVTQIWEPDETWRTFMQAALIRQGMADRWPDWL